MPDFTPLTEKYLNSVEAYLEKIPLPDFRTALKRALDDYRRGTDFLSLYYLLMLKQYPVSVKTFIYDKHYLNMGASIYEKLVPYVQELNNPDGDRLGLHYYEAVFTGGIGYGKTTAALITTAYQLYLLSCFRDPHEVLDQDKSAEILFIFQSLNAGVARDVDYNRFRSMIELSPYFRHEFPYDKDIKSRLVFPHRIEALPVTGEITATIGQNVYGGIIDEVNFMAVISQSSKKRDGGVFDQARELYNSINSRRSSRFMQLGGVLPGILCLVSSANYPGQFTDRKREEAKTDRGIYFLWKRLWDIRPPERFSGRNFRVFLGDITRKPYIMEKTDVVYEDDQNLVDVVPVELRSRYETDIYNAIRETSGIATLAKFPFIPNVEAVADSMNKPEVPNVFSLGETDFKTSKLRIVFDRVPPEIRDRLHFAHIDLGHTGDSAGVVVGCVQGFKEIKDEGTVYAFPDIRITGVLCVHPPRGGEINFSKIRKVLILLRDRIKLKWVTFDSYQSVDSIQILRSNGFSCGQVSLDRTSVPYDFTKEAIYQRRVHIPRHDILRRELVQLERLDNGKIDHPEIGSKDIADALAGVVYGLTMRRETWAEHGVPVNQLVAARVSDASSQVRGGDGAGVQ